MDKPRDSCLAEFNEFIDGWFAARLADNTAGSNIHVYTSYLSVPHVRTARDALTSCLANGRSNGNTDETWIAIAAIVRVGIPGILRDLAIRTLPEQDAYGVNMGHAYCPIIRARIRNCARRDVRRAFKALTGELCP